MLLAHPIVVWNESRATRKLDAPATPDANPRSEFFNSIEGSGESGSGPTLALAYAVVSRVLNARGVYSDALLSAQEASRLDPANGNYFDDEAEALIGLRRFSEAIDASNQAIRLTDGKFSFTHFHLGWSYLEL